MTEILVPVSPLTTAKGRLAGLLTPDERARVISLCLQTVLDAIEGAGLQPAVLTSDPRVRALVGPRARLLAERPEADNLNRHLEDAILAMGPPQDLVILHADLPLATSGALRELLAAARPAPSTTIVESNDGGTNAMVLRPPRRFELAYGPRSAARHSAAAAAAGMAVTRPEIPELQLDLDTPADVRRLLASHRGAMTPVGRFLSSLHLDRREGPAT